MELSISFSTIVAAALSFLGVYFLMPMLLISRDFLILKVIDKYILDDKFWTLLRIVSTDKAIHNERYADIKTQMSFNAKGTTYTIDGQEVSDQVYLNFERGREMHLNRINQNEPKIMLRRNLIVWVEKYYKLDSDLTKQVDEYAQRIYDNKIRSLKEEERIKQPPN
ncbi:TPA: hypothetical protein U2L42_004905 [Citrobacter amalonaticus]|uniref:hypothetical protein n=1 Tax=Citrobacter TaxID=544 RepID=UPI0004A0D119|nr:MULTISPECIES: hypothetical protein [Citrobacter]ELN9501871.1 hypothetical protein [Citrobacter amalonaticus]ELW9348018.1 hypothetical protein [Citrobacter amalonaticus]KDF03107.1 hypothetical protein AF41_04861 [Citrobacter sp. MGH 55]WQJ85342.1 hypothetical protein U4W25_06220 [Citrobacter amalonaticus]GJK88440.1 hypothetical protein TUM17567_47350 [Citrobacter amalonaticus]